MTTVATSSMTLSNVIRCTNDDQQVPDSNSVVVPPNASGIPQVQLPAFNSLFLEPQSPVVSTPELLQSLDHPLLTVGEEQAHFMEQTAPWGEDASSIYYDVALSVDNEKQQVKGSMPAVATTHQNTNAAPTILSMVNASQLMTLEPVRPTTLPLAPSQGLPPPTAEPDYSHVSPSATTPGLDDAHQTSMTEIEEECDAICRRLWIPRDPRHWKTCHVQKWMSDVCSKNMLHNVPPYLQGVDGATLCTFTQADLTQRTNAEAGPSLFADLEWMKAACGSPEICSSPETFTDLDKATSSITQPNSNSLYTTTASSGSSSSSSSSSSSAAETAFFASSPLASSSSVSSSSSSSSTTPPMLLPDIPVPNLDDFESTKLTFYQLNSEVEPKQQLQPQQKQFSYLQAMWGGDDGNTLLSSSCDSSLSNGLDCTPLHLQVKVEQVKVEQQDEEMMGGMETDDDEDGEGAAAGGEKRRYVSHSKHTIHLWQFLRDLLLSPERYGDYIKWQDRAKGIFKIENSREVAKLWGERKNRPAMNYDKLSRSIRQYYKKGIIKKTSTSKRLVYQFQPTYL